MMDVHPACIVLGGDPPVHATDDGSGCGSGREKAAAIDRHRSNPPKIPLFLRLGNYLAGAGFLAMYEKFF